MKTYSQNMLFWEHTKLKKLEMKRKMRAQLVSSAARTAAFVT